jgi:aminoglycoside 6'-N-acetyltransferase
MVAMVDKQEIGFIQAYSLGNYPAYAAQVGRLDAVGIDLFLGEESRMNQGLGSAMLMAFVETVLPLHFKLDTAVIGPEPANKRAIQAYEKAGFRYFKTIENPREAMSEYLMKRVLPKCNEKAVDMKA